MNTAVLISNVKKRGLHLRWWKVAIPLWYYRWHALNYSHIFSGSTETYLLEATHCLKRTIMADDTPQSLAVLLNVWILGFQNLISNGELDMSHAAFEQCHSKVKDCSNTTNIWWGHQISNYKIMIQNCHTTHVSTYINIVLGCGNIVLDCGNIILGSP